MNKSHSILFLSFLLLVIFYQCRAKKPLIKEDYKLSQISRHKADSIARKIVINNFEFNDLKAKINTKYRSREKQNLRFGTFLKMKKDSIIHATISVLNFPVFVALITPDSIKLMNKREKTYFEGEFSYLSTLLKSDISFSQLQDLLIGNPVMMDTNSLYYFIKDNNDYFISTDSDLKRLNTIKNKENQLYVRYWVNELCKTGKTIIVNDSTQSKIEIFQADFNKVGGRFFPNRTRAEIVTPKDSVNISLNYQRVKINSGVTFNYSVPNNYTRTTNP